MGKTYFLAIRAARQGFGLRGGAPCRLCCCLRIRQHAPEGRVELGVVIKVRLVVLDRKHLRGRQQRWRWNPENRHRRSRHQQKGHGQPSAPFVNDL
jgi:hypothetical protein